MGAVATEGRRYVAPAALLANRVGELLCRRRRRRRCDVTRLGWLERHMHSRHGRVVEAAQQQQQQHAAPQWRGEQPAGNGEGEAAWCPDGEREPGERERQEHRPAKEGGTR